MSQARSARDASLTQARDAGVSSSVRLSYIPHLPEFMGDVQGTISPIQLANAGSDSLMHCSYLGFGPRGLLRMSNCRSSVHSGGTGVEEKFRIVNRMPPDSPSRSHDS